MAATLTDAQGLDRALVCRRPERGASVVYDQICTARLDGLALPGDLTLEIQRRERAGNWVTATEILRVAG